MVALGQGQIRSRVTAEFYNCALSQRGANTWQVDGAGRTARGLSISNLASEEAKLRRIPPIKKLALQSIVVIGAVTASTRSRLALVKEGAHIVCVDVETPKPPSVPREGNHDK